MIWVTVEDVIAVHSRIIKASGGLDGIRDRNSLEAAVNAPLQTFAGFDLFETDLAKIARIGFGLASNHAFLDGNKRIGAMMTQLLLKWNGYVLELKPGELADSLIYPQSRFRHLGDKKASMTKGKTPVVHSCL